MSTIRARIQISVLSEHYRCRLVGAFAIGLPERTPHKGSAQVRLMHRLAGELRHAAASIAVCPVCSAIPASCDMKPYDIALDIETLFRLAGPLSPMCVSDLLTHPYGLWALLSTKLINSRFSCPALLSAERTKLSPGGLLGEGTARPAARLGPAVGPHASL